MAYINKRHELAVSCHRPEALRGLTIYHGAKGVLVEAVGSWGIAVSKTDTKPQLLEKLRENVPSEQANPGLPRQSEALEFSCAISSRIIICTRWSNKPSKPKVDEAVILHSKMKLHLKAGRIIKNAVNVPMFDTHRESTKLKRPLPTMYDDNHHYRFMVTLVEPLLGAAAGTEIILLSVGIEALSGDESGLVRFYDYWKR